MESETLNKYNPWVYFTVHLSAEQINAPLSVVAAFFDDDQLPGQLAMLKVWREFVLKPDYYRGPKNSPSSLLYFHKLNIALIEAIYLLNQNGAANDLSLSYAELAKEKNTWTAYPVYLSTAELNEPFIFLQAFFAVYSLPEYRRHLTEWLEHGLSRYPAGEFISTVDLITVYENIQKLYEAAWVIHQRVSDRPYLKLTKDNDPIILPALTATEQQTSITLYSLNTGVSLPGTGLLSLLVKVIKHKVPSVQSVIYLGTPQVKQSTLFLLILTNNEEREQAQALAATIEESCREITSVAALVHYASALSTAVENNNPFFSKALTCPVIYLSGELLLPAAKPVNVGISNFYILNQWERWQRQGMDFLDGAKFHLEKAAANAALFCLHQCVECLLVAILRAVAGYRVNSHNLSTLLRLTKMFTADSANVFAQDDEESKELFNILKHAYVNVRYKDSFKADRGSVQMLYSVVQRFVTVTSGVYHKHLLLTSI